MADAAGISLIAGATVMQYSSPVIDSSHTKVLITDILLSIFNNKQLC